MERFKGDGMTDYFDVNFIYIPIWRDLKTRSHHEQHTEVIWNKPQYLLFAHEESGKYSAKRVVRNWKSSACSDNRAFRKSGKLNFSQDLIRSLLRLCCFEKIRL